LIEVLGRTRRFTDYNPYSISEAIAMDWMEREELLSGSVVSQTDHG
jgi:hypothetical protein